MENCLHKKRDTAAAPGKSKKGNSLEEIIRMKILINLEEFVQSVPTSFIQQEAGRTFPLHLAIKSGCPYMLPCLILNGCDMHALDSHGESPLLAACRVGDSFAATILLLAGEK
jgi:hypothetical protein